jgi:nucleotide-binding universal stress UspA family protein
MAKGTASLSRKKARARPARGLHRLLVPLDFTERDRATLKMALLVAEASRAFTTLLHVVYAPDETATRDLRAFYSELSEKGHAKLVQKTAPFRKKHLQVAVSVLVGRPLEEILAFTRDDATDLIVLSSHAVDPGRPAPGWNTLSYQVAALCGCPVLLAK